MRKLRVPTLADKITFAERHIKTREGVAWSLKGREWVRDEFWLPADGFKLWRRRDSSEPCHACAPLIGEIVEHPSDNPTKDCECGGLAAEPILVTILNLDRGDGKTFNVMAYTLATLFLSKHKSIAGLWASEDQGAQIFEENWASAIQQAPMLLSRANIFGNPPQIEVPSTRSMLEVLAASYRSLTGRRRTHIIADEARDIEARTITALLPSVNAMHGTECPSGHVQLTPEQIAEMDVVPETCTACGKRLVEWWPRIILVSASGLVTGTEKDWLHELIEELSANPHPNYHLFTSEKWGRSLNPRKSARVTGALADVFGKLPSTKHYMDAELGGAWTRKGEDVVTVADVKRIMDPNLTNGEGSPARAVGFLDTSTTVEKTSLVILTEETDQGQEPWQQVSLSYLEYWWPGHNCGKRVPDDQVKRVIESVVPLYPGLIELAIDTRAGAKADPEYLWPTIMLRDLRAGPATWRKKIRPWTGAQDGSNDVGFDLFIERILDQTIRLQWSQEILDEIKGITLKRSGNAKPMVTDRNRKVMHRDITQSIACCCYMIKKVELRGTKTRSMADIVRRSSAARAAHDQSPRGGSIADRVSRLRAPSTSMGRLTEDSW